MSKILKICILSVVIVSFCLMLLLSNKDRQFIRIGTASLSGVYYSVGSNICSFINESREKEHNNLFCDVQSTPGSLYNLNALKQRYVDVALVQNDWAIDRAISENDAQKIEDLRSIATLQEESFVILVRDDSDIHSFKDLKGHVINHGIPGTGVRKILDYSFDYLKWDIKKDFPVVTELRSVEQAQSLCDGKIDMMVDFIGNPSGMVQEAVATCNARLINLDDDLINHLTHTYPFYKKFYLSPGMYNNTEDVKTISIKATLYTVQDFSEESVYILLKSMYQNIERLRLLHPLFADISLQSMYPDSVIATIPLHPGAKKFYDEFLFNQ
ncbi:TAXI family TRAP transporter solute-binding subunit [Anaplasmataceae bacterium AB001_6]|nr:TAXI family TRAP transporter solute-binding subunit [Anaplasmataceae bacterium AB001_6]